MLAIPLLIAGLLAFTSASSDKKIVCYYADWTTYREDNGKFDLSNIDASLCTHIVYSFVLPKGDGSINIGDGAKNFNNFVQLRNQNPSLKLMVAIGGWNEHSARFSKIAANPGLRQKFVQNVYDLLKKYELDGFDVDWEYPTQYEGAPADKKNFVLLLKDLKEKLAPKGLLLSAAVAMGQWTADQSYDIPEISKYLDFINLMAYDMHGPWEQKINNHAPLYPASWETEKKTNIDSMIKYWTERGAPVEKLVLGAPFYGKGFTLTKTFNGEPPFESPTTGPCKPGSYSKAAGTLNYNEICQKIKDENWQVGLEKEQRVPFAYKGDQWVGYDNERSLTEKANYVNAKGLGGMMIWSLDGDDFRGICGGLKYPLLKAINKGIRVSVSSSYSPLDKNVDNEVSNSLNEAAKPKGDNAYDTILKPQKNNQEPGQEQYKTEDQYNNDQYLQENNQIDDHLEYNEVPQDSGEVCNGQGYFKDPENPANFYQCWFQGEHLARQIFTCAAGLVFDSSIGNCNWPQ